MGGARSVGWVVAGCVACASSLVVELGSAREAVLSGLGAALRQGYD